MTTTFRDVFRVYKFFFYLRISESNPWKLWHSRSSLLRKFKITIWNFSNSELQETYFHAFYPHTSLLLWQIILNCLDCFVVLYLRFYILRWLESKIYGRYLSTGLTHSQVYNSLCKILLRGILCHQFCSYLSRDHFYYLYVSFFFTVLFLIAYREYFNITFYYSFIYSFSRF